MSLTALAAGGVTPCLLLNGIACFARIVDDSAFAQVTTCVACNAAAVAQSLLNISILYCFLLWL